MSKPIEADYYCPTLFLLLREPRVVSVDSLRRAVAAELGMEAAATVEMVCENAMGGAYFQWRNGPTHQHLGTSNQPFIHLAGQCKKGEPVRWQMREEVPPDEPSMCEAWMAHNAWLYVDALNMVPPHDERDHAGVVFRIASWFVDDRCVLLWLRGGDKKRVALPSAATIASLRRGQWPG